MLPPNGEEHVVEFWRLRLLQGVWEVADGGDAERKASRIQQSNFRSDRRDRKFCGVPPMESCSWSNFVDCGGCEGVRRSTMAGSRRGGRAASARSLFFKIGSAGDVYLRPRGGVLPVGFHRGRRELLPRDRRLAKSSLGGQVVADGVVGFGTMANGARLMPSAGPTTIVGV